MARRKKPTKEPSEFADAAEGFREGLARICRLYGQSPLLGRLYAELYLHDGPIALEDVCARVGAAKSTVSVALRKLLSARVVRRVEARADRRDRYEAVVDPWAIVADWSRLFLQPELDMWRETGGALERSLRTAPPEVNRPELHERLVQMSQFAGLFEGLLNQVTRRRPGPPPARSIAIRVDHGGDGS